MGRRSRKGAPRVQQVSVVDGYAGSSAAYIDRCIQELQATQSQVAVLCSSQATIASQTNGTTGGVRTAFDIRATDDFQSMRDQFELYRVRAIRFDLYDINPSVVAPISASTFHDVAPAQYGFFTPDAIVDAPDSQVIAPGTGKISLYWRAKSTDEMGFQSTSIDGWQNYGGLRFAVDLGSAAAPKVKVVMKAIVDFRART